MSYFNPAFLQFFDGLSKNNSKEWFDANRKTYEKEVKRPFSELVSEMILRIQQYEPEVQIKASDAIMRINKDIRFSKDKTPYNTHVSANISAYGKKDKSYPGFYFQLSQSGVSIYGGAYMVDPKTLHHIRSHISDNLKEFSEVLKEKKFREKYGGIKGDQHKRIPKEFQAVADEEPLIANKQFYYNAELGSDVITSDKLDDQLMEYYLAGKKVNDFLKSAFRKK